MVPSSLIAATNHFMADSLGAMQYVQQPRKKQQQRYFVRRLFHKNPSFTINRINPIFDENEIPAQNTLSASSYCSLASQQTNKKCNRPQLPSSGYNSNTTTNSSSNCQSDIFSDLSHVIKTVLDGTSDKSEEEVLNDISAIVLSELNKRTSVNTIVSYENVPSSRDRINTSNLIFPENDKPSVWQIYYDINHGMKMDTDYSLYDNFWLQRQSSLSQMCRGRPEADFTLDLTETEILKARMKSEKKWRCRCRIIISILGFVFFVFSVMAVSMILTRGRRMFGSMF